ncbi:acyltransferase [Reinekea forsetii]|nr:acyltransferase [Reinekea forsetii]
MLVLFTLFIGIFVFLAILLRVLTPRSLRHKIASPVMVAVANFWISANLVWMKYVLRIDFHNENPVPLTMNQWSLVISNHRSWVDIFALFAVFHRKIPILKFFIKKEMAKVPVVGQAWWALDYPFMQRHSKSYLAKYPEKVNDDLKATKKACEKFSLQPTSVVNFLEGTRFSEEKHGKTKSPYKNLLKPKAGGIAFTIQALGRKFSTVLDVTIAYGGQTPSFWDMACGRVNKVRIHIQPTDVPEKFLEMDYRASSDMRVQFQEWLNERWKLKDALLEQMSE